MIGVQAQQPRLSLWRARAAVALLALTLAFSGWAGCASEAPRPLPESPGYSDQERTAALMSMSVGFHKRADLALAEGKRDEAKAEIARLLEHCVEYNVRTPDGYDVLFDAATRLSRMHVEDNELAEAEKAAQRALARGEGAPPSLFLGYLHQALADVLEKKGDARGAVDQHGAAITIFKAILDERPPAPRETPDTGGAQP
ncbi:MAG: hypothetical protein CMH57_13740 [Myxococcales bacterium]|nr:hypothetical protein [Myxococcales bacterium]